MNPFRCAAAVCGTRRRTTTLILFSNLKLEKSSVAAVVAGRRPPAALLPVRFQRHYFFLANLKITSGSVVAGRRPPAAVHVGVADSISRTYIFFSVSLFKYWGTSKSRFDSRGMPRSVLLSLL
jgi:hypothetical protein